MCFLSLIFAAGLLRLFFFLSFYVCFSVPAAAFLLSQRTQINGGEKKKRTDLKNRCLKRAFLKLPIGEFALLEVGHGRWKTIL